MHKVLQFNRVVFGHGVQAWLYPPTQVYWRLRIGRVMSEKGPWVMFRFLGLGPISLRFWSRRSTLPEFW